MKPLNKWLKNITSIVKILNNKMYNYIFKIGELIEDNYQRALKQFNYSKKCI